jgi:hypothetical protein
MLGYVDKRALILDARLVLTRSVSIGINPFGSMWKSDAGPGPAVLEFAMVGMLNMFEARALTLVSRSFRSVV